MQNVRNMRSNSNTVFINKMWFKFASNSLDVMRYIFDAKRSFPLSTLCRQRERERESEREDVLLIDSTSRPGAAESVAPSNTEIQLLVICNAVAPAFL